MSLKDYITEKNSKFEQWVIKTLGNNYKSSKDPIPKAVKWKGDWGDIDTVWLLYTGKSKNFTVIENQLNKKLNDVRHEEFIKKEFGGYINTWQVINHEDQFYVMVALNKKMDVLK